ncbi:MAG: hypothetical protein HQ564_03170 [Candidatus Saganbacteria bacterium]|nr:hypothetical protein [Candidatus Saganbacteria bacterium]
MALEPQVALVQEAPPMQAIAMMGQEQIHIVQQDHQPVKLAIIMAVPLVGLVTQTESETHKWNTRRP